MNTCTPHEAADLFRRALRDPDVKLDEPMTVDGWTCRPFRYAQMAEALSRASKARKIRPSRITAPPAPSPDTRPERVATAAREAYGDAWRAILARQLATINPKDYPEGMHARWSAGLLVGLDVPELVAAVAVCNPDLLKP